MVAGDGLMAPATDATVTRATGNRRGHTVAIVQARMRSRRLPGKVMVDIGGRPAIELMLHRLRQARRLDGVWLACSDDPSDDPLAAHVDALGVPVFRGDAADVLGRYASCAAAAGADVVVRMTGDCPLMDATVVDHAVDVFDAGTADYVSNGQVRSYPDGLDVEVFSRAALDRAAAETDDRYAREHVTPYIHGRRRPIVRAGDFARANVAHSADFSHLRWTLDTADDLALIRAIVTRLGVDAGWQEIVALLTREPALLRLNAAQGASAAASADLSRTGHRPVFTRSDALLERALNTVPLASQTFSKSYLQWPRGAAPMFVERGRGCRVWDVDGNCFIDHVLALLPIVLGYTDPDVDAAVTAQMQNGVIFSMPHPLEVEVAELLTRLIPCAEMVRFGKNGSDATTAAVRLARAHTGRDRVAIAGYHGWHDWYIGTTTRDLGVPESAKALSSSFVYNDADTLKALVDADPDGFAAVVLEPVGVVPPAPGFLAAVRENCDRHGIVLVFDEIVCGFRVALGGASEAHGVLPDLACFGKSMANGYPVSAVVGRRDIMRRMEDIFFSGTFGGETLSLAAAKATLEKLERETVPARRAARGGRLAQRANEIFAAHGLDAILAFAGNDWWPRLRVTDAPIDMAVLGALLRQEVIANGLLMGASLNLCLAHDDDTSSDETADALDRASRTLRGILDSPDPAVALRGSPLKPVFQVRTG